MDRSSSRRGFI